MELRRHELLRLTAVGWRRAIGPLGFIAAVVLALAGLSTLKLR